MSASTHRTAIVTGSSRGIGAAIAKRIARDGVAVLVNYAGRAADAEKVVEEIKSGGGRAIAQQGDVSKPADVEKLFSVAEAAFGPVDILVNNAGVIQPGRLPLAQTSVELFTQLFDVNCRGTFNALRIAASRLRSGGRIVNFSSSLAASATEGTAIYAGAKAAVEVMTRVFAKELRGRQITVNAVAPGPTATELFLDGKTDAMVEQARKASPFERLGEPEDIAGVVAFLIGPEGGWVNGQTIRVNGGVI